eukprot:m.437721 g.437721  ORF g.437721 m.437721 type:complete len:107 (-) comp18146_c0_seq1:1865-2185(-)
MNFLGSLFISLGSTMPCPDRSSYLNPVIFSMYIAEYLFTGLGNGAHQSPTTTRAVQPPASAQSRPGMVMSPTITLIRTMSGLQAPAVIAGACSRVVGAFVERPQVS